MMTSLFSIAAAMIVFAALTQPAKSEIVISSGELEPGDILSKSPLVGLRSFPQELIVGSEIHLKEEVLPVALLREAATTIPEVSKLFTANWGSVENAPAASVPQTVRVWTAANEDEVVDWRYYNFSKNDAKHQIAFMSAAKPRRQFSEIRDLTGMHFERTAQVHMFGGQLDRPVDPYFVAGLLETELFTSTSQIRKVSNVIGGPNIEMMTLNAPVARAFKAAYGKVDMLPRTQRSMMAAQFQSARSDLDEYPKLHKITIKPLADIEFGRPHFYPAAEKNLSIPRSISDKYEVFWAEFSFSNSAFDVEAIQQLDYRVSLPDRYEALELIPLAYGPQENIVIKGQSPSVAVEVPGRGKVAIGEIYSQTVSYETLRPEIYGIGLNLNSFSWRLTGDAVRPGARRFVAIIGAPKGAMQVTLRMDAVARVSSFFGLQADMAATNSIQHTAALSASR